MRRLGTFSWGGKRKGRVRHFGYRHARPEWTGPTKRGIGQVGESVPIVFLSGHGDIPTSVRAIKAGAVDFLTKPVQKQTLLSAVEGALAHRRRIRSERAKLSELQGADESLTPRESVVFSRVTAGKLNKQIAVELGFIRADGKRRIAPQVMEKLNVQSLAELARIAEHLDMPDC